MSKKDFNTPTPDENMFNDEKNERPTFFGRVKCDKLNIRSNPIKLGDRNILCVADKNTQLEIDPNKSTKMWYSVTTPAGIEGYCMKEFVLI